MSSSSSSSEDSDDDEPSAKKKRSDVRGYYHVQPRSKRKSRKFKTSGNVYDVTFTSYEEPFEFTYRLFNDMVTQLYEEANVRDNDKVRISITHPDLEFGIHIPFDNASQISGHTLLNEIEKVSQSNRKFKIHDGQIHVEMTHITMPEGSGTPRRNRHFGSHINIENMAKVKRSIVKIDNAHDSMCLARSIVVGICNVNRTKDPAWEKRWHLIRQSKKYLQEQEARNLLDSVGISHDQPCGVDEYKKIQQFLYPDYVIKIWPQFEKMEMLFEHPPMKEGCKVLHVYYHDGHYDCITSITGFLGCCYFCEHCNYGYKNREGHMCKNICVCYAPTPCPKEGIFECCTCGRTFYSQECFDHHKQKTGKQSKSICELVWKCMNCHRQVEGRKKNHLCPGTKKCKYCKEVVGPDHQCFIPTYQDPEYAKSPEVPFIFFDFECRFDSGEHIPNFCVAQRSCGECMCQFVHDPCKRCEAVEGPREMIFRGDNTLKEFCTWLFQPNHKGTTVIAHNAQGYDAQFILRYILTHGTTKPELIMKGSKIMMMKAHQVRFIDSLSFLNMPLSAFPKTFGLKEMAKGWFPFYANTHEYQHYKGGYLPVHFYRPDSMKPAQREAFLSWYNERVSRKDVFDFKVEMEKYCKSDVDILRRGCGEFRKELLQSDQIDPFIEATTLAQVCNKAWRKNSMPPQSLAVISDAGYPNKTRYSMKAIRWIQATSIKEGKTIQHALNGGEVKMGPYYLDGYEEDTNTAYEFMGCWSHGCIKCYRDRDKVHAYSLRTMEELYNSTLIRVKELREQGITVVQMWECDFDQKCKTDPEYRDLVDQFYPYQDPIEPRDALFGGRTNAIRLYHEVDENTDQEIKYADVCSLYPFVNKYRDYPVGHPEILSQEQIDKNIGKYRGLIKCRVLPPQDLWLPVLPIHCNKKMVFALCRSCAEEECQQCNHSLYKRCLTGTWTSVELAKAIDLGYKVLDVYHVWHWNTWSSDVYRKYIDKYLKLKQEASGYPDHVHTDEDKKRFKQGYFAAEGIWLENVEKNPGKRAFAKTMLNCLWGKNAQNNVQSKSEYVDALKRFYDLLSDPCIIMQFAEFFDHDNFMLVNYKDEMEKAHPHSSSNPVVASFVTAYARLELYNQLEQLGDRILYFDTDSCMYIYDKNKYNIPIEDSRLGKWTDEVPNGRIVKFVALGPKNYGYEYIEKGERHQTCKVKGITLDYKASQIVNFKSMVDCVRDRENYSSVVEYESRIRRHKDRRVTSETQTKTFRSVYTKRVLVDGYKTIPYGYKA